MKRDCCLMAAILGVAIAAVTCFAASEERPFRNWTSKSGSTIEARLVKVSYGKAYLETKDGKSLGIRLTALSQADQTYAKEATAKPETERVSPASRLSGGLKRPGSSNTLTDKQIESLKTQWTDEKTGKRYVFSAGFGTARLTDSDKRKYAKSGKVPVRITAYLSELKEVKGKQVSERQKGTCRFYVLDGEGNEAIKRRSSSLDKMCPS